YDLAAEPRDRGERLLMRRAGRLAQPDRDVVGARALDPVGDGRTDLLAGPVQEPVRRDALEREVLARVDLVDPRLELGQVGPDVEVEAVDLHRVRSPVVEVADPGLTEEGDVRVLGVRPVARGELRDRLDVALRVAAPAVGALGGAAQAAPAVSADPDRRAAPARGDLAAAAVEVERLAAERRVEQIERLVEERLPARAIAAEE